MKKIEIVCWLLLLVTTAVNIIIQSPGIKLLFFFITAFFCVALAMLYFYLSIYLLSDFSITKIFKKESYADMSFARIVGTVGIGPFYCNIPIAILFCYASWPVSNFLIIFSLFTILIASIIAIRKISIKKGGNFYKRLLTRNILMAIVSVAILLVSFSPKNVRNVAFPHVDTLMNNVNRNLHKE